MQSFAELLDAHGVAHQGADHKHGRDGWVQVNCPWCGGGGDGFHMGYNINTGHMNCWKCGRAQPAVAIAALLGCGRSKAASILASVPLAKRQRQAHTGRLVLPAARVDLLACPAHLRYLRGRGFDPATLVDLWGLEAIGLAAKLAWRVFIPVYQYGEIVSWTTRAIGDRIEMRYVAAGLEQEAVPSAGLLYGEDYARHAVIVNEGPTDVWAIGPGAVATLGTSITAAQIKRLASYPVRVVCYDNEPTAQKQARELVNSLSPFPGYTYNVTLDSGSDAATADPEEIALLRHTFL